MKILFMKEARADIYRYYGNVLSLRQYVSCPLELKYIYLLRKCQKKRDGWYGKTGLGGGGCIRLFYRYRLRKLSVKTGIQIPWRAIIGPGFYIGHCGRIIINPLTIIGKNVNIATGVTIGQTNRGDKKGAPVIGDCVWIGTNAVIVGKIKIGSNVLIAPNAYVNIDIPDNSIVIGNPATIHHSISACDGYINNRISETHS